MVHDLLKDFYENRMGDLLKLCFELLKIEA